MARFSKCPTWWVRAGLLKTAFPGGRHTGESIAALKCIIGISHAVNYYSLEASLSFSDLEAATGLSRPMVAKGVKLLETAEIINVRKGYRNTYVLTETNEDKGWAKLPIDYLKKELPSIPNRGRIPLFALKLYIQLLADRPNDSSVMHMTYDTIQVKVGTQTRDIKPSIDTLFNHNLFTVHRAPTEMVNGLISYKKNEYHMKGF